jgi:hypothetical protein
MVGVDLIWRRLRNGLARDRRNRSWCGDDDHVAHLGLLALAVEE